MNTLFYRLPVLAAALAASTFAQDYFPLHVGNTWVYRVTFAGRQSSAQIDILRNETVNGRVYSMVRGIAEQPVLLRTADDGATLLRFNPDTRQDDVWANFATPEGQTYRTSINPCSQTARVESRTAKLTVPAAEFSNALKIAYPAANCADAGLQSEAYAPYIGLIERTSTTIAGPSTMQLTYARVGGVTVLSQPESSFALSLDGNIFPVTTPPGNAVVRMTLRNTTPTPLTLNFSSTQRFNLLIRNARGAEVYNWSATRTFAAVMGSETVNNGEINWVETLPLATTGGQPLPAGIYTVEAVVTSLDERPRYTATASFEMIAPPTR